MATEGPIFRHTQSTASENLSSTAGALGPNGTGQFLIMAQSGARTVARATVGTSPYAGILQNDPISGGVADVAFAGVSKVMLGGTVSAGNQLMATTGGAALLWTTGNYFIGTALEAGVSGQVISCLLSAPGSKA